MPVLKPQNICYKHNVLVRPLNNALREHACGSYYARNGLATAARGKITASCWHPKAHVQLHVYILIVGAAFRCVKSGGNPKADNNNHNVSTGLAFCLSLEVLTMYSWANRWSSSALAVSCTTSPSSSAMRFFAFAPASPLLCRAISPAHRTDQIPVNRRTYQIPVHNRTDQIPVHAGPITSQFMT